MATIIAYSLQMAKIQVAIQRVLPQVERAEKKNFTRTEAMDLNVEMKKRNTILVAVLNDFDKHTVGDPDLVAYAVIAHSKTGNVVTLHKICILNNFRRQGIANRLLKAQINRLKMHGSRKLQLWVDESNLSARQLYANLGFNIVNKVDNYYAPGRTGICMALGLK